MSKAGRKNWKKTGTFQANGLGKRLAVNTRFRRRLFIEFSLINI
jgi:hypothetical protein